MWRGHGSRSRSAVQSQKAVNAHFSSEQLLPFYFEEQYVHCFPWGEFVGLLVESVPYRPNKSPVAVIRGGPARGAVNLRIASHGFLCSPTWQQVIRSPSKIASETRLQAEDAGWALVQRLQTLDQHSASVFSSMISQSRLQAEDAG